MNRGVWGVSSRFTKLCLTDIKMKSDLFLRQVRGFMNKFQVFLSLRFKTDKQFETLRFENRVIFLQQKFCTIILVDNLIFSTRI